MIIVIYGVYHNDDSVFRNERNKPDQLSRATVTERPRLGAADSSILSPSGGYKSEIKVLTDRPGSPQSLWGQLLLCLFQSQRPWVVLGRWQHPWQLCLPHPALSPQGLLLPPLPVRAPVKLE